MAEASAIEWTDATWNPITGCSVVSSGCTNCYAMKLAGTRLKHHPSREGLTDMTKAGPVWNGQVRFNEQWLDQPLRWKKPRMIFVCAHGDLFHEGVPDDWIDRVFAVMALCPQHTFQVLTKRSARMREYVCRLRNEPHLDTSRRNAAVWDGLPLDFEPFEIPLPNVWLGVSVEDQKRAEERIPHLLNTPAAIRFVSAEPLLGPVNIDQWLHDSICRAFNGDICTCVEPREISLDWVIVGGESGPGARPMHPDWVRSTRDQCAAAETAFFFKQWGEWVPVGDLNDDDALTVIGDHTRELLSGDFWTDDRMCRVIDKNGCDWTNEFAQPPGNAWVMRRVGKKTSGHRLDGVEHREWPEVKS